MENLEKKIILGFGLMSLVFIAMTIVTLIQVNRVIDTSRLIQNVYEPSIVANLKLTSALNRSVSSLNRWTTHQEETHVRERLAAWSIADKMYNQLTNYARSWIDGEHRALLQRLGQDLERLRQLQDTIAEDAHTENRTAALKLLKDRNAPLSQEIIANLQSIYLPQRWEMERIFTREEKQERILINTAIIFLVLGVVGSMAIGVMLARAVLLPLNQTTKLASLISEGDYSLNERLFSGNSKLDVALRSMVQQLNEKKTENEEQQRKLIKNNRELEKLNRDLSASNNELSQFSYRTSHDLKAPLITVRGLAQVIEEDIESGAYEEARQNAGKIVRHVGKLERLISDILNLAKAELVVSSDERLDLEEIITGIRERMEATYIDNDVKIEVEIDDAVEFHLSKVRVSQILENLVSNAVKYCDPEKPDRYVRISTRRTGSKKLCIVEDNGVGIPEDFKGRVFGMFQRFHPHISYGSGLGLYIIKKHIDKMGGQISFESSENGTTFSLEFNEPFRGAL